MSPTQGALLDVARFSLSCSQLLWNCFPLRSLIEGKPICMPPFLFMFLFSAPAE